MTCVARAEKQLKTDIHNRNCQVASTTFSILKKNSELKAQSDIKQHILHVEQLPAGYESKYGSKLSLSEDLSHPPVFLYSNDVGMSLTSLIVGQIVKDCTVYCFLRGGTNV